MSEFSVEETQIAHLAGVFDGIGGITTNVVRNDEYRLGYNIQPLLRIQRSEEDVLLGKLMAYCEENSAKYNIREQPGQNSPRIRFVVSNYRSINNFLEPMMDYLTTTYFDAQLMVNKIIPMMEEQKHTEKKGFIEIVEYADKIRSDARDFKYDKEYFEELWSLAE